MGMIFFGASLFVLVNILHAGSALKCWHCSSDVDPLCHDTFNITEIFRREGRGYGSQDQQYDPNRRYDSNQQFGPYNQNYQGYNRPPYNSQQINSGPRLEYCNDEEARIRGKKNVCLKKVQKLSSSSLSVIRRCDMIPLDKEVSTCYDPVNNAITLEFCEYCDYEGCNSATNIKINYFIASVLTVVAHWLYSH